VVPFSSSPPRRACGAAALARCGIGSRRAATPRHRLAPRRDAAPSAIR